MSKKYSRLFGDTEAGYNLSWGAVFAGVVTFIALFMTLSTIGSAIGLGMVDFTRGGSFLNGADTGVGIWAIIQLILSFAGAGFVSGITARRVGLVHGFLTWATSIIATVLLTSYLASSALTVAGNIAGTTTNVVGDALSASGDAISTAFQTASDNINFSGVNIDTSALGDNAEDVLRGTEITELQPEYIENQAQEAGDLIANAGQEIILNPENANQIIQDTIADIRQRTQNILDNADEQAIANSLQNNSDMSQSEAEEAASNFISGIETAVSEAETAIDDVQTQLEQTRQDVQANIQQLETDARQTAESASNTASNVSIGIFIGLVLSALISAFTGLFGSNLVRFSNKEGSM